jgi:hypothetical protein
VEGNGSAPRIFGPDRHRTCAAIQLLKRLGDACRQLTIAEQRLRIAGGKELDVAVTVEDGHRVQRSSLVASRTQRKRAIEIVALRFGAPFPCQETMCMLTSRAHLGRKLGDREPFRS